MQGFHARVAIRFGTQDKQGKFRLCRLSLADGCLQQRHQAMEMMHPLLGTGSVCIDYLFLVRLSSYESVTAIHTDLVETQ